MKFVGNEVTDTIQMGDLVITGQGMGAAILSEGFDTVDGILGLVSRSLVANIHVFIFLFSIGPTDLTEGMLDKPSEYPFT